MNKKLITEKKFIKKVEEIVRENNCDIDVIDNFDKTIMLSGSSGNQIRCAIAISEFFEEYEVINIIDLEEVPDMIKLADNVGWII